MNSVRAKCLSLKYKMFTPSGCKDIDIRKFDCVVKTLNLEEQRGHKVVAAISLWIGHSSWVERMLAHEHLHSVLIMSLKNTFIAIILYSNEF